MKKSVVLQVLLTATAAIFAITMLYIKTSESVQVSGIPGAVQYRNLTFGDLMESFGQNTPYDEPVTAEVYDESMGSVADR